jgi:RNA polymerase sigma factor (TIGR02999 family)
MRQPNKVLANRAASSLNQRMDGNDDVSRVLELIAGGDVSASNELVSLAYKELRRIAANMMAQERAGHTLQPTALVHEAYLRMAGPDGNGSAWNSKGHFFAAAGEAMRRILIENARRKMTAKRGGGAEHTRWDDSRIGGDPPAEDLLELDAALEALEAADSDLANVVKLRFFVGMTVPETAAALGTSARKVNRQWKCARAWLYRHIYFSD